MPPHVEREAAALDSAATLQMHHMFTGGAAFEADEAAAETEALRLWIGRMWGEMVKTAQAAPDDGRRLHLYSAHDGTVSPLLLCVCQKGDPLLETWPPFCSNLCVELWASEADDRRVRVLFNGSLVRMACSDADGTCSVADFAAALAVIVTDYRGSAPRSAGEGGGDGRDLRSGGDNSRFCHSHAGGRRATHPVVPERQ